MTDSLLLIMVKNPELGKCKTRLAKTIGDEKALTVYKQLLNYTASITQNLDADVKVLYSSYVDNEDMFNNSFFIKDLQTSGALGIKMQTAFEDAFKEGYKNICIIGSDCRELTTEIINRAFDSLKYHDAVIGPANDGGYYLLGLNTPFYEVFKNKIWSTNSVCKKTMQDFEDNNLIVHSLPQLSDVDLEEDLIEELIALVYD